MARKMGRNLKRAAAGLMACAAIALCAVSPAWADDRASDVVNVTVPTRIECALGADGTVTAPGGLEVVNIGPQDLYVGASTLDDFGQKVEFAMDLGGSPLLSRTGGKDVEGEVEFAGSSRKGLVLSVSKLNRMSHAALMDAAAQGEAPMFTVGFRFTFKALQGTMAISGEAKLGKTLTATVSGAQADAKLAYRWYRDGQLIAGAETASYTANEADQGKKLKCEAYDAAGRYVGGVSAEVGPVKGPEAFAVFSADDGSLNFYKRVDVPKAGEQFEGRTATEVYTGFEEVQYQTQGLAHDENSIVNTPWYNKKDEITHIKIVDTGIRPNSLYVWFKNLNKVIDADISKLDTSTVTNMSFVFSNCTNLKYVELSGMKVTKVKTLSGLFYHCRNLKTVDISTWQTSSLTNISMMLDGCRTLENVYMRHLDVDKVITMNQLFWGNTKLKQLDLSGWHTTSCRDMSYMFCYLINLQELDISNLNSEQVSSQNMANMFIDCKNLRKIRVGDKFKWGDSKNTLSTPSASNIPGADGFWYDAATGDAYKSEEIPNNKAATYVAVNPIKAPTVTIEGEPIYGSSLTAKVSGQPAGTTATSYQWQWSIDGKNWRDSQYESAKTESITLVMNGEFSPENNYYRCVVNTTAGKKRVPKGISNVIGPIKIEAFAVYSKDDGSLNFYRRPNIPATGSQFEGKTATKVYASFENSSFTPSGYIPELDNWDKLTIDSPWFEIRNNVTSVKVVDSSFSCENLNYYFYRFEKLKSVDLSLMNATNLTGLYATFCCDSNVETIRLPAFTSSLTTMRSAFVDCCKLKTLDIKPSDYSGVQSFFHAFQSAKNLTFDCSEWNVNSRAEHEGMNDFAPGVILPKVWQLHAFAVFSSDDGSLNFYKRAEVPEIGSRFEGKTVTDLFTGFEEQPAAPYAPDFKLSPFNRVSRACQSITVIDEGISPITMESWFLDFKSCRRIDLAKLHAKRVKNLRNCIYNCDLLEEVDLSGIEISEGTIVRAMLQGLPNLKRITVGPAFSWSSSVDSCRLDKPSPDFIPGADGKWYAISDGMGYAPDNLPNNKADTYYASKTLLPAAVDDVPGADLPSVEPGMNVVDSDAGALTDVDTTGYEEVVTEAAKIEEAESLPDKAIGTGSNGDENGDGSGFEMATPAGSPPEEEGLTAVTSDEAQ